MSKVLSVRVADDLAEWIESYAKERGVERTVLLANAIEGFREDCRTGVPDLKERVREMRRAQAPKPGECSCPKFPDGVVGFSQRCPVHGGQTREDFARSCADRSALFAGLSAPESVRFGVKKEKKP